MFDDGTEDLPAQRARPQSTRAFLWVLAMNRNGARRRANTLRRTDAHRHEGLDAPGHCRAKIDAGSNGSKRRDVFVQLHLWYGISSDESGDSAFLASETARP